MMTSTPHIEPCGFQTFPYNSVKLTLVSEEVLHGNWHEAENPFHWSHVKLNMPGQSTYDPTQTWIAKVRRDG